MELPDYPHLNVKDARVMVRSEWERLSDNYQLSKHLVDVQKLLDCCNAPVELKRTVETENQRDLYPVWKSPSRRLCMVDLMHPPLQEVPPVNANGQAERKCSQSQWATKLRSIISESKSPQAHRSQLPLCHRP